MTEIQKSNTPMILAIVGFVASIPGLLCSSMCAGVAEMGGSTGASSLFMTFSLIPSIAGFVFGFMSKSKAKLAGIVLIVCSVVLLISTIVTFNWFWGLITVATYLIAGILSFQNE